MKSLMFGSRRPTVASSQAPGSVEAALAPALVDGHWSVPSRFNFTRDVVEALARDRSRRALTYLGRDVVIEPRTFQQLAHGAARWSALLREADVRPGDRVVVAAGATPDWAEVVLACLKVGAVAVPSPEHLTAEAFDIRIRATGAKLVIASNHAAPNAIPIDSARRESSRLPNEAPTHETAARDAALVVYTTGRTNGSRGVLHTHAATFAARVQAEHWLDAGLGDVVWCTASPDSPSALWSTLFGPWARGASVVLHDAAFDHAFDAGERLELLGRLGVTVLCQTPAEYRALAETGLLARHRWARPRRLVSTGDELPEDVVQAFEDEWGLTIHDGLGQAEIGVVLAQWGDGVPKGSIGRALPGYEVAVVDERGEELPPGQGGSLAIRVGSPSLFAGYWNAPEATNAAYRGDWFLTGDSAVASADGLLWLGGRTASASAPVTEQEPAPASVSIEPIQATLPPARRVPIFARLAVTLWLLLIGVMVGGAAIPHAQDKPRVVPKSEDAPNAICLVPKKP